MLQPHLWKNSPAIIQHYRKIVMTFGRLLMFLVCCMVVPFNAPLSRATALEFDNQNGTGARGATDPCIVYTYDASGDRQTQTITISGGGMTPTWGTGTWGCFKWTP